MVIALFGSWIVGAVFLYLAQKRPKKEKWILRVIAILCFIWPLIARYI